MVMSHPPAGRGQREEGGGLLPESSAVWSIALRLVELALGQGGARVEDAKGVGLCDGLGVGLGVGQDA